MRRGIALAHWPRVAAGLCLLVLCGCLSDRPLRDRRGATGDRADDAVGHVTVSTPLFSPLDEPLNGRKRLDLDQLLTWKQVKLSLTAPSFAQSEATYDLFSLAVAVQLASSTEEVSSDQRTTTPVTGGGTGDACVTLFCDADEDGEFDTTERPMVAMEVTATLTKNLDETDVDEPQSRKATTDENGRVCFDLDDGFWVLTPTGPRETGVSPRINDGKVTLRVEDGKSDPGLMPFLCPPPKAGDPGTSYRSNTRSIEPPKPMTKVEREALLKKTRLDPCDKPQKAILDAITSLITQDAERNFSLPPDVLATLTASIDTYMTNLEEFYNVDGFDYRNGLSGRYVPYKAHFQVTAEPGWFSRYRKYDAVVDVELSLLEEPGCAEPLCKDKQCDEIIVLHVSPLETAQTINEFAAAMTEFAVALRAAGSPATNVSVDAQAQRLNAAAERLQGTRAHNTMVVGFPASNRVRLRFVADRVATDTGRDLQPVSRIMTATVLVPADAAGRLDARSLTLESKEKAEAYKELLRSSGVKDAANADVRNTVAQMLEDVGHNIAAAQSQGGRQADPFLKTVIQQAALAVKAGESVSAVLPPLLTLLRDQVPETFRGPIHDAIFATLKGVSSENVTGAIKELPWIDVFAKMRVASNLQIVEAFRLSARRHDSEDVVVNELAKMIRRLGSMDVGLDGPTAAALVEDAPTTKSTSQLLEDELDTQKLDRRKEETDEQYARRKQLLEFDARRTWLVCKTLRVLHRMFLMEHAFDDMGFRLQGKLDQHRFDLGKQQDAVKKMLCGARCGVQVSAYFSPTMFGPSGDRLPPRDYLFNVDPPDARVRAATQRSARVAPIPPWMGPLDDHLKIIRVEGTFAPGHSVAANRSVANAKSTFSGAKTAVKAAETALADAGDDENKKKAAEKALATANAALVDATTNLQQARTMARTVASDGRAVIRVEYSAPTLLLDSQESLVHVTEVYARVLGLGEVQCRATAGTDGTQECGAGGFCRILPGNNEAVIEIPHIDLTLAAGSDDTKLIRAYVQLVAVPLKLSPHTAWSRGAAEIATSEVLLVPQEVPPPKPNTKGGAANNKGGA